MKRRRPTLRETKRANRKWVRQLFDRHNVYSMLVKSRAEYDAEGVRRPWGPLAPHNAHEPRGIDRRWSI